MVASQRTAFYLQQFTENPRTPTDIFTARHITPNIRSSLLPKLCIRVNTHITDYTQKHSELQNIRSTLRLNGFPTGTAFLMSRRQRSQNIQYNHFTSILYIKGTSEKFKRVLNEAGLKVAMKPISIFGGILQDPSALRKNLVYQVPCFNCDFVYIGQAKRDLKSRLAEHKLAIKNQGPEKSALREHSIQFDHLAHLYSLFDHWNYSLIIGITRKF